MAGCYGCAPWTKDRSYRYLTRVLGASVLFVPVIRTSKGDVVRDVRSLPMVGPQDFAYVTRVFGPQIKSEERGRGHRWGE